MVKSLIVVKIGAFCLTAPSNSAPSTLQYEKGKSGMFSDNAPSASAPSTLQCERGMLGQVLRVKGYYDVMIHKHHSEDVYDLIGSTTFINSRSKFC